LEWLGSPCFWLLEENGQLQAAFACPPDPERVAWIRLFIHSGSVDARRAWSALWDAARAEIAQSGGASVAAIVSQPWFRPILAESGFDQPQSIVLLEWRGRPVLPPRLENGFRLRPITIEDLPAVDEVDAQAFGAFWHNSPQSLHQAFSMSLSATLIESERRVMAYQLSTSNPAGAHLARLAVRKEAQGRGLAEALVADLIHTMRGRNAERITVNTQNDNRASLALYQKMGFHRAGEEFPVYRYEVAGG
jgi:ribosomal-protein-alanine N-acetyltransferase